MPKILYALFIIGPPTHSVRGQTSDGRWRLSSSVTLHRAHMQRNSPGAARYGGPVVLRPVTATPCFWAMIIKCEVVIKQYS